MKLPHPSPSMAVSIIALVVALGGTSYAAIKLPANSVGSRELKPRSVQTSDLAVNTRLSKSNKIFRAAVTDVVLDPNTQAVVDALAGAVQGAKGDKGDAGPAGAAGSTGGTGATGVSGYVLREAFSPTLSAGQEGGAAAKCDPGERVVSGGGRFEADGQAGALLTGSYPEDDVNGSSWLVVYSNGGSAPSGKVHAWAVCAKVS
jgi:hypothetical protein